MKRLLVTLTFTFLTLLFGTSAGYAGYTYYVYAGENILTVSKLY